MENMDGQAESGRICESDSKIEDHDKTNCGRGVVTVRDAGTWQRLILTYRIMMKAPNTGVN